MIDIKPIFFIISLFFLSYAFGSSDELVLKKLSPENLGKIKMGMEVEVEKISGHPVRCEAETITCILFYDKLASLDWKKAALKKGTSLIAMKTATKSAQYKGNYILDAQESAQNLQTFISGDIKEAVKFATSTLKTVLKFQQSPPCEKEKAPKVISPCSKFENYFDDLLKDEEINITIVKGYRDQHPDGLLGFFIQQIASYSIEVSLDSVNDDVSNLISELQKNNFSLYLENLTNVHLRKKFYYKGKKKTVNVHIYRSTVSCDNVNSSSVELRQDRNFTCEEQKKASLDAKNAFEAALGHDQVVIYNGHARFGRGPDFGPLWEKDSKFPINSGALKKISLDNKKTVLFLDACSSLKYYEGAISKVQDKLSSPENFIFLGTTQAADWADQNTNSLRLINMILEAQCPKEWIDGLNSPRPYNSEMEIRPAKKNKKIFEP